MQTQVDPNVIIVRDVKILLLPIDSQKKKKKPETAKLNDTDQRDLRDIYRSFI